MSTKRGRTIDPNKITTVAEWANGARIYTNLVLGSKGEFQVMSPKDVGTLVKVIPHLIGYDALTLLSQAPDAVSEELRAAAEKKYEEIQSEISGRVVAIKQLFTEAEDEYLDAIDNWRYSPDAATRTRNALHVSNAQIKLAAAEKELRSAQYPHRYIFNNDAISRKMIYPGSGDDRMHGVITRWNPTTTIAKERVVHA